MKKIILLAVTFFGILNAALSQSGPITTTSYVCSIKYSYDDAGNRTQRIYSCNWVTINGSSLLVTQPPVSDVLESIVFPNPSNGVFSIKTNWDIPKATVIISDMAGRTIKEFPYEGIEAEYNIRTLALGQYMIQLVLPDQKQVHRLLKNE
jgi:Secretion system C-terminal sorting domain